VSERRVISPQAYKGRRGMKNSTALELETWIVEVGGDVVEKEAAHGRAALTPIEKLIYCLWVADYGMRNAGDLVTASDVYSQFQEEAASLALELGMPRTHAAFALPTTDLEERYFDLLSGVVDEIDTKRGADGE
jgi:hypothetical protein